MTTRLHNGIETPPGITRGVKPHICMRHHQEAAYGGLGYSLRPPPARGMGTLGMVLNSPAILIRAMPVSPDARPSIPNAEPEQASMDGYQMGFTPAGRPVKVRYSSRKALDPGARQVIDRFEGKTACRQLGVRA